MLLTKTTDFFIFIFCQYLLFVNKLVVEVSDLLQMIVTGWNCGKRLQCIYPQTEFPVYNNILSRRNKKFLLNGAFFVHVVCFLLLAKFGGKFRHSFE
jgi:hypothetical protein